MKARCVFHSRGLNVFASHLALGLGTDIRRSVKIPWAPRRVARWHPGASFWRSPAQQIYSCLQRCGKTSHRCKMNGGLIVRITVWENVEESLYIKFESSLV